MRLIRLQIFPKGDNGWSSESLMFGQDVTQLFGPNGCGKSPLIKSIVFCLGYPSKFRDDILENCLCAELEFEINNFNYVARRNFKSGLDVVLTDFAGVKHEFLNELDYSKYLFELLGFDIPTLVSSDEKKAAQAYFSALLPIYYLDQEEGYRKYYSPSASFIKDQLSESIRIILGVAPKNAFDAKKKLIDAKRELEQRDKQVYVLKKEYESANDVYGTMDPVGIDVELKSLYQRLEELKSGTADKTASTDAIDELIGANNETIRSLDRELGDISKRDRSFQKIHAEIQIEINTLSLNEEAKRVFSSFEEICNSPSCQLFSFSSDSYGKNLLYLKDQLKDLERNVEIGRGRSEQLSLRRGELVVQTQRLTERRNSLVNTSDIKALVEAITHITSRIFGLEQDKKSLESIEDISNRYVRALSAQDEAISRREELEKTGQGNPLIIRFRSVLRENMLKWMDILDTNNVSSDIKFEGDFVPILGSERLAQLGGSTRLRVILAYHAALLECFEFFKRKKVSFIIFDTPKQHEMHGVDLGRYIDALKIFSRATGVQIIISGTEYHYVGDVRDKDWEPKFSGSKQKMFLKRGRL